MQWCGFLKKKYNLQSVDRVLALFRHGGTELLSASPLELLLLLLQAFDLTDFCEKTSRSIILCFTSDERAFYFLFVRRTTVVERV